MQSSASLATLMTSKLLVARASAERLADCTMHCMGRRLECTTAVAAATNVAATAGTQANATTADSGARVGPPPLLLPLQRLLLPLTLPAVIASRVAKPTHITENVD
jgi:hypothetical protein